MLLSQLFSINFGKPISKAHRGRESVLYHGRVDAVVGVECETGQMILVDGENLKSAVIYLRDTATKNNQQARVRLASDYALDMTFPDRSVVGVTGFEPVTSPM